MFIKALKLSREDIMCSDKDWTFEITTMYNKVVLHI